MKKDEIELKLEEIRENKDDDEAQHAREDDLHHDVLRAIAAGCDNPAELAAAALKSLEIKFSRWCA